MKQEQYLISKEDYLTIKQTWSKQKQHSAKWHILYNILRSKSASSGFVEKTKAIQSNDPWFAYHTARGFIGMDYVNPWADLKDSLSEAHRDMYSRAQRAIDKNKAQFKEVFGIDFIDTIPLFKLIPKKEKANE